MNRTKRTLRATAMTLVLIASGTGAFAQTPEAQCHRDRSRIEARHVSCAKACEKRFHRSLRRTPIDVTACKDECRLAYDERLAAFEAKAPSCERVEIDEIGLGSEAASGTVMGTVRTPGGSFEAILDIVEGEAVFEGDIVIGDADEVASRRSKGLDSTQSAARSFVGYRWPLGVVPFTIATNVPTTTRQWITDAIRHWEANTPIRFVNRTTQTAFVTFNRPANASVCQSRVGRQGNGQAIDIGNNCGFGAVVHEIGHAVGLWHEHTRSDRDANVIVHWDNIKEDKKHNFRTYGEQGQDGMDIDFFDFDSIMMYSSFIRDGTWVKNTSKPVLTRRDGTTFTAQRGGLSRQDIAAVRLLYRKPSGSIVGLGDRCLQVANGIFANRTPIQATDCRAPSPIYDPLGLAQQWMASGGRIRSAWSTAKVVDMPYWTNGSGVWIFDDWGGANQRFELTGVEIRTTGGNCVSAVPGVWQSQVRSCAVSALEVTTGSIATRRWTYTAAGEIRTAGGLCLDVQYWDTRNGTPVVAHSCGGGANQKWTLGRNGQIRGYGNKCLDVRGWQDQSGTGMQIWDCHGGTNQAFTLRGQIREPGGKCLDLPSSASGSPTTVWDCHTGANQKFDFFP